MAQDGKPEKLPTGTYGFIGIGVMGYPMALNLLSHLDSKSKLVICDVVQSQVDKFLDEAKGEAKVEASSDPSEIVRDASVIITMLPKGPHVWDVFTKKGGLLDGVEAISNGETSSSKLFMECSTIDVATSNKVNDLVLKAGHKFADCPVSGGWTGAVKGSLTFMVGGPEEVVEQVRPIAATMGNPKNFFACGKQGAGLATKQINNFVSFVSMLGVSEGHSIARRYGLNAKTLADVMASSTGRCFNGTVENPVKGVSGGSASSRDFSGGFSIELCKGVVEMALELGEQVGAKSVLRETVLGALDSASEDTRCKGKDYRSVYLHIADIQQDDNHL